MNINISLDKNFTTQYNRMQNDYGSEMAELNGFSDNQLSYTDFIDNFVDEDTVADASIDGNSNVSHKDIVTLEREMPKPHSKLLAFNKIYYEIQKKYGFKAANEWLKEEWIGDLYLHDASSSTFRHYCFTGDTKILTDSGIKTLKSLEGKDVKVLNKNHAWENARVQYFGNQRIYNLVLERYGVKKEIKVTPEHVWFVKEASGCTEVQTRNLKEGMKIPFNTSITWSKVSASPFGIAHGFVTGDGYKNGDKPRANFCGDKKALITYFPGCNITGTENELTVYGVPKYFCELPPLTETTSYLYGWLSGYFAADGCVDDRGRCTISSVKKDNLERVRDVLCVLGMPVNDIRYQDRVSNLTGVNGRVYTLTLSSEYLTDEFFLRPTHRQRIIKDRDKYRKNRSWSVVSVDDTGKNEDVYCAVVPGTQSFTLDGNILTHNCFAYDLKDLAEKGLYFIEGRNSSPAKHLITFVDFVKEFVSYAANRSSGAVGLPNLIPYMYYFWKKDVDSGYLGLNEKTKKQYAMQNFQRFIYAVNQPYCRDGSQSAFTNTSVFDHPYFEALFGGSVFPDGTPMIDCEDDIIEFQKWYMEKMSDIRSENMFTFPVKLVAA